jgi:hypothetical protein
MFGENAHLAIILRHIISVKNKKKLVYGKYYR